MPTVKTRPVALNLSMFLALLLRYRVFVLIATLAAGALLFCLSLLIPNSFKATVLVMSPDHSSSAAMSMLGPNIAAAAALSMKNPTNLYVALMRSPAVEDAVIQRFDLTALYHTKRRSLVQRALEADTEILADAKTGMIAVSFVGKDPQQAANIANGIVQEFEKFYSQLAIMDAGHRRAFFESQIAETKGNLTGAEDALEATSSQTGVLEPKDNARAVIGYELQLRAAIATKTVALQAMKVYLSDDNPEVQVADRELASLRQEAGALEAKNGSNYSEKVESSASLDYLRAQRDVRSNEALYAVLSKDLEGAQLDEARNGDVVQIVSPATVPDIKSRPHRSLFLLGGFLLGLVGSSFWVLLDWARSWVPGTALPSER